MDCGFFENFLKNEKYKTTLDELLSICLKDWDPDKINSDIIKSQKRRLMIKAVPGDPPDWDFISQRGDDKRYVRKEGVDATKGKLRIPPVETVPPDMPALSKLEINEIMTGKKTFLFKKLNKLNQ